MAFDPRAFIGRPVKELDAALKQHQTSSSQSVLTVPSKKNIAIDAALRELTDEDAESSVRRAAALKIGAMGAEISAEDVARVIKQLANPHNCHVGGGAMSVRRAALLAFTELALFAKICMIRISFRAVL